MRLILTAFIALIYSITAIAAPSTSPDTPFKLATFEADGMTRLGMVLGGQILDIRAANAALSSEENLSSKRIPRNMRNLIESYDGVKSRLYQIANHYNGNSAGRSFSFEYDAVTLKAPIKYPYNMLAAAANYQDHSMEMARRYGNPDPKPVDPDRSKPVFFAKSPRSSIIDPGTAFPIPPSDKVWDFENELAVIIGKKAKRLTLENAKDHVFGYSIVFDVSTRDNPDLPDDEEEGGFSFGVNWFEAKSRDNAAPFGPVIVPREFIGDSANLQIMTKVNGIEKQNGNSKDMIHNEERLLRHVTSILTLYPGDVVLTGTPAGVGSARTPPEFLKPGDVVEMSIEGIGTMITPITAEEE
ncbi:fumarylacetoacetate hydrolase family protein [Pseudemcibacter aquimaris]|uniref:fumarylacetoacetate hydrolase family protein n=1 Tax=Pseudemcibacter aquimaris TaxID=2857064 RepID=UPI00201162A4|nr:fumarylacetoacetate hydrolase family protein [Pseudemcibacter aquimaris]MCC3860310.1 fumarylacetoacetate hydrolase family protein [Pseudemcibacter aquimaris]WDU57634.1 fumarylacetoacetate hydrolase family protein [Pseudemcibacter aquimaris]